MAKKKSWQTLAEEICLLILILAMSIGMIMCSYIILFNPYDNDRTSWPWWF